MGFIDIFKQAPHMVAASTAVDPFVVTADK